MAEARDHGPDGPPPLEDLTNKTSRDSNPRPKKMRRTRSSRALYRYLDSSESIPSFRTSIWDADVIRSDDCHAENYPSSPEISPTTPTPPGVVFPTSCSSERLDELSDLPAQPQRSVSHNGNFSQTRSSNMFHPTQLEPIVEQRSIASLRSALSRTRLGLSPARNATVIHPQQPHHSFHPAQRHKSPQVPNESLPASFYHRRSFSLDDLDCFKFSFDCSLKKPRSPSSSSSDGVWLRIPTNDDCWKPAEPCRPSQPPPERTPTPPGVPSFGSPEALNYFNQPAARSPSWWRILNRSTPACPSSLAPSAAATALAANLNPPPIEPPRPTGVARCISLFSNTTQPPTTAATPRRASMPAGVLRAEDGTLVRGRFGGRVSGHGISSRGLDGHPIQRAANRTAAASVGERKDHSANDDGVTVPRQRPQRQDQDAMMMSGAAAAGAGPAANPMQRRQGSLSRVTSWLGRDRPPQRHGGDAEPVAADTRGPHTIDTAARPASQPGSESTFWHCLRWFCICCCEMTEHELDGCGWYGADRPWLRDGDEIARVRREGRAGGGDERNRNARLGERGRAKRGMKYRAGGSQG